MLADAAGRIWAGTAAGLVCLSPRHRASSNVYRHDATDKRSLASDRVTALYEGQRRRTLGRHAVRASTASSRRPAGFVHHLDGPGAPFDLRGGEILTLTEDLTGGLWIGGKDVGLVRYELGTGQATRYRADLTRSAQLAERHDHLRGARPLGRRLGGAQPRRQSARQPRQAVLPLPPGRARGRHPEQQQRVVDLRGRPRRRLAGDQRRHQRLRSRAPATSACTAPGEGDPTEPEQQPLHGDPRGPRRHALVRLRLRRAQPLRSASAAPSRASPATCRASNGAPSLRVYAFAEEADGTLWMGCAEGVQSYDPRTGRYTAHFFDPQDPYFIGGFPCKALLVDRKGHLWLGTYGDGVVAVDPGQRQAPPFPPRSSGPVDLDQQHRPLPGRGQPRRHLGRHQFRPQPRRPGHRRGAALHRARRPAQQHHLRHPGRRVGRRLGQHRTSGSSASIRGPWRSTTSAPRTACRATSSTWGRCTSAAAAACTSAGSTGSTCSTRTTSATIPTCRRSSSPTCGSSTARSRSASTRAAAPS